MAACGALLAAISAFAQDAHTNKRSPSTTKPPKSDKDTKSGPYEILGAFTDPEITESSGVAMASPLADPQATPAFWTFNDSGGKPALFRVDLSGNTTATIKIAKTINRDWECMCAFDLQGKRHLAIADVGDNAKRRKNCQVYILPEPVDPLPKTANCKKVIDFTYEDGPHDCEAIGYNAADNSFWLVEKVYLGAKRKNPPGIYRLENPFLVDKKDRNNKPLVARKVGTFNVRNVTGMAFSPDRTKLIIRSYFVCYLFTKANNKTWLETVQQTKPKTIVCPLQSQGEAICFMPDSKSLLLTSELARAQFWKIDLEHESTKPPSPTKPAQPKPPKTANE